MNRYLTLWLIGAAMVAFLGAGSPAGAMSAYSRIYKMECSECHTKSIPELNDFGIEFYKNRLVIPGKEGSGTPASDQAPKGEATAEGTPDKTAVKGPAKVPAKSPAADGKESGEEAEEEQKPVEEPPPTVVYRVKSADGSVFFTDNPLRKGGEPAEQARGAGKTVTRRARRAGVQHGVKQSERVQPAIESRVTDRAVAPVVAERYPSYEECMERVMVRASSPGSAQEMMDFIMGAEKKCGAFPPEKR
ncbi:hypothetical protein RHDC3_02879 [Rhodocyclaceae bacterium]|nr:hypothetical protein RHDC3_02879 [Rhodocyclaceae bacterium]